MSRIYEAKAAEGLEELAMNTARELLHSAAQKAAAKNGSYSHFLGYLPDAELKSRHQRRVEVNTRFAHFPYHKHPEDFDFSAQPSIDPKLVDELATLRFLSEGRNIVLSGPPGVGKAHLAIALASKALQAGQRALLHQRHGHGPQTGPSHRTQPPAKADQNPHQDAPAGD